MVEVDSDIEDDFEVADFNYFDLDGDKSITMKELITKLNPSASIVEKEELAVIVSSAPNFDLNGDGYINMRDMITNLNPPALICCGQEPRAVRVPVQASILEKEVLEPIWKKEANIFGMNPKMTPSAQGNLYRGIVNLICCPCLLDKHRKQFQ